MEKTAKLTLDGKTIELPIIIGTEKEKAVDITKLRAQTGYITLDNGFGNTGSCTSEITYLDGENGILRYRGIPIEQIAEKSTFVETAFLLIYDHLPTEIELSAFSKSFTAQAMIHEDMKNFFNGYHASAHPMLILSAMVASLASYYPELAKMNVTKEEIDQIVIELISKVRTIAAFSYKKSIGQPFIYPRSSLKYIDNFIHMMFADRTEEYEVDPEISKILEMLFILHADHEQNCSTSTVRLVGSSGANLFASVSAGINALWGPRHGGANQKVIEMLEIIYNDNQDIDKYIEKAKNKRSTFRLMGFGHRVYKSYDPRAKIIKKQVGVTLNKLGVHDPLVGLALKLEEKVLKDDYFIERNLYPNVDFYSGIIYKAIGIPVNMFPVMFALARIPGWIANWKEMVERPIKIGRPRQIYTGENVRDYINMSNR